MGVHLRFCKAFLGLNRKASNHAARAEMGRFPLQIVIVNYIIYLNSKDNNSIVKQMFLMSQESVFDCPNSYSGKLRNLFALLNSTSSRNPSCLTKELVSKLVLELKTKYEDFWLKKTKSSTKLDFYRKFKQRIEAEAYLDIRLPNKIKSSYRIYSIKRPGRLFNFWTLRVGA